MESIASLTDRVERPDVVEDENFLHLVGNFGPKAFDELINIDIVLGENVENGQSGNFREASVAEVNHGISGDVSGSDLQGRKIRQGIYF